jgi:peroxiredoxin
MARESRMLALGTKAPEFRLPDAVTGKQITLEDFAAAPALLVAFVCNDCPYVKHVLDGLVGFAREYAPNGLATVAISSNDVETHPQDGPAQMAQLSRSRQFTFPYLYDESQSAALAYEAACTPDFFLFDRERKLVYRGQFDGSRPGNKTPVTGADLRTAVDALLAGKAVPTPQIASIGCGIKWKRGVAPDWA